ncbi:MAG: ribosome-associated translation inhibitor RaiA [Lachnospiraceae bacterium]
MKYRITGKKMEVTDGLRNAVTEHLDKLGKYFQEDVLVEVTMRVEKSRQIIEVTIPLKGGAIRTEQSSSNMYISIDLAEEVLERQLKKHRRKLIDQYQSNTFQSEFLEEEGEEDEIRITRSKRFDVKPMYPEDACLQMEMTGHEFFAFVNAQSNEINVVYKRTDGTYGILEPDF